MDYTKYLGRGVRKSDLAARPIVYLPNTSEWVENIYCLMDEDNLYTADNVLGGVYGVTNAPIQALANRTYNLNERVEKLTDFIATMYAALSDQMNNIKAIKVSTTAPTSEYAWLNIGKNITTPTVKLIFADNTSVTNPNFRTTFESGRVVLIRSDGISGNIDPSKSSFED